MEVHAKSCGRRLRKAWISRRNNPLAGRLNSFSRNYSVETTELNPNSADGLAGTEPSACRADILVCRFTELSSSVSGDWKVARTGRLESLPHTTDSVPTSEFGLNPNSAVEMGSARLRRASSGVVPELSPHHLPSICGGKKFAGRSFRRDAENHTPEACAPRDFGLCSVSTLEIGKKLETGATPVLRRLPARRKTGNLTAHGRHRSQHSQREVESCRLWTALPAREPRTAPTTRRH